MAPNLGPLDRAEGLAAWQLPGRHIERGTEWRLYNMMMYGDFELCSESRRSLRDISSTAPHPTYLGQLVGIVADKCQASYVLCYCLYHPVTI